MIAIFVYQLTRVWFRHIWPEIRVPPTAGREEESRLDVDRWTYLHPDLMTLAELRQATSNLIKTSEFYLNKLLAMRREKPVTFCLVICSSLSCTAYIGNRISGSTITLFILTVLVSAPAFYLHLLPKSAKDYLRKKFGANQQSIAAKTITSTETDTQLEVSTPTSSSPLYPLSLFEHLRRKSSSSSSTEVVSTNVQTTSDNNLGEVEAKQQQLEDRAESCHNNSKSSDDLSLNESTSLIDFDDEQQDGFVIL